jgi:hypothetical protein
MKAALGLIICLQVGLLSAADPDPSVESGRKALGQWTRYPWYDSATETAQPLPIAHPRDWSFLSALFDWFPAFYAIDGHWIQIVGLGLLGLFLALIIYLIIRAMRAAQPAEYADSSEFDELARALEEQRRFDALPPTAVRRKSNLLEEARRYYRDGNYGEAVIYLFSYQLLQLDKQQLIRLTKGKTNRQYLRELGPRAELGHLLAITMAAFEDVFFGNHPIDRVRFEACWLRLKEFESLVVSG